MEPNSNRTTENTANSNNAPQAGGIKSYRNNTGQRPFVPKKFPKPPNKINRQQAPLLPNTIYNTIIQFKTVGFSRKDLRKISNIVKTKYKEQFGDAEPNKIDQTENEVAFQVYCYPESMRKEIKNIVTWYFKVKKERKEKHGRLVARERLEKLKKEGSPEYEMALVKYNMAEEERRKKEKLLQAEQLQKAKLKSKYGKPPTANKPKPGSPNHSSTSRFSKPNSGNAKYRQPRPRYNPNDGDRQLPNNEIHDKTSNESLHTSIVPTATPTLVVPPQPPVETNSNTAATKPKLGFVDRFLNKIKGNSDS